MILTFKVSSQSDASTLVKVIRIIYGSNLILTPFPSIEIAVNILKVEEVAFTLVINKKHKRKSIVSRSLTVDFILFSLFIFLFLFHFLFLFLFFYF